jgi:hypothetical protein
VDFVVAGFGFGALMVVVGFIVRDVGPFLWRRSEIVASRNATEASGRWRALCHGISSAMTVGGVIVILVTAVGVVAGLSDSAGSIAVLAASIAGVAVAAGLSVRTAQEYRRGKIRVVAAPAVAQRDRRPVARGISTQKTGPLPSAVKRAPKPEAPIAADPTPVAPPPPHEPFDVNRLLPEEFHHDEDAAPSPAETVTVKTAGKSPAIDEQAEPVLAEASVVEAEPLSVEDVPIEAKMVESEPNSAEATANGFQSPLFADLGGHASSEGAAFNSKLLADVQTSETTDIVTYQSPILADLIGPTPAEPETDDSGDDEVAPTPIGKRGNR